MAPSKFTEIMDPSIQSLSPESDVRLEDIIAASDPSGRGRAPSEGSSRSDSTNGSRQDSNEREKDEKTKRRLSRLLSLKKR